MTLPDEQLEPARPEQVLSNDAPPGKDSPGSAQAEIPKSVQISKSAEPVTIELKPLSQNELAQAIDEDYWYTREKADAHDIRAGRWDVVAKWARLVVALTAAVSTIALIADNVALTMAFSITTAIIAAINAAFNPPDTSAKHRQATKEYVLLARRLSLLSRSVRRSWSPRGSPLAETDLAPVDQVFRQYRLDLEQADERAPALNRLRRAREESEEDSRPTSWWGLWRFKRQLHLRLRARRLLTKFREEEAKLKGSRPPGL